jgi:hypothetical protein
VVHLKQNSELIRLLPLVVGQRYDVDQLGWTTRASFLAYGCRIGVRVNDVRVLKLVPKCLPYGSKPSKMQKVDRLYSLFIPGIRKNPKHRVPNVLFGSAECLACSFEATDVLEMLERDARLFVAEHAQRRIFVHAGVVGWNGRAIVIPGKSMSGKTRLTAALVRAGASYYSDEFAVFDEQGRVHPYAKPLSVRGGDGYSQTDLPVETFGGRTGTTPLRVGMVLVTRYGNRARWRPQGISAGMGALALLANTIAVRRQPEKTLDVLRKAVCTASVLKGLRGEAGAVVESMLLSDDLPHLQRLGIR